MIRRWRLTAILCASESRIEFSPFADSDDNNAVVKTTKKKLSFIFFPLVDSAKLFPQLLVVKKQLRTKSPVIRTTGSTVSRNVAVNLEVLTTSVNPVQKDVRWDFAGITFIRFHRQGISTAGRLRCGSRRSDRRNYPACSSWDGGAVPVC